MRTNKWRSRLGAGLAGLALWLVGTKEARALSSTATLNIDVTINQNLSVAIVTSGNYTSTEAFNWTVGATSMTANDGSNPVLSSVTVVNDSGGQTERWGLSTLGNSIQASGGNGVVWTLTSSTGSQPAADNFAVQAVFGSSMTAAATGGAYPACPAISSGDWNKGFAPPLTTSAITYGTVTGGATQLVDTSLFAPGTGQPLSSTQPDGSSPNTGEMFSGSKRSLCWRLYLPVTTSASGTQNVQIVVTAQAP